MTCSFCGGRVLWMGPLINLTHTQCQNCGQINCQEPEADAEYQNHIERISEQCGCDDPPCDACLAGGLCDAMPAERPTPITDAEGRNYPQPEYLQLIQFEGCTMGVITPEYYAELYEKCSDLERQLAEVREQRDSLAACLIHLKDRDWFRDGETGPVVCSLDADQVRTALSALKGGAE